MAKDDKKPESEKAADGVAEKARVEAEAKAAVAAKEAKNAKREAEESSTEGLVKMQKGDETTHVHPSTVESHKTAGWKLA